MNNFFVPRVPGLEKFSDDELYVELAKFATRSPAVPGRRIARIVYDHDGVTWTAEVGRTLRGERRVMRTRNKRKREVVEPSSDPATVLAIFAGVPHMVVTDKGFNPTTRSRWMNPFLATAKQETYFQS